MFALNIKYVSGSNYINANNYSSNDEYYNTYVSNVYYLASQIDWFYNCTIFIYYALGILNIVLSY